ncbi:hypothetical protein [Fibrella forsythiae]|uniref:Uncharacterized protein n=1 Tax=Fibrella forsythiae TaxID=2817061 RepID=A0ABS3JE38_9BACT|nr:hypothetical protein [Fibrella forsythiae]MBO0947534.1 hypothetical protein [Fibrella forsythiae]
MAEPIKFPEANVTLTAEGCGDLPVCRTKDTAGTPLLISRYKLSEAEMDEIQRTGCIYLIIYGEGHPPVRLTVISPFLPMAIDN